MRTDGVPADQAKAAQMLTYSTRYFGDLTFLVPEIPGARGKSTTVSSAGHVEFAINPDMQVVDDATLC